MAAVVPGGAVREEGTVRITYNHRRDEFDTVFSPERMFDFRVEGCFLPSESSFAVDSEGFRDQSDRYKQLSALPYRKDIFSVGGGFGVPNWVADKLNYIFSTSFVLIDEMKYSRSESAVPENFDPRRLPDVPLQDRTGEGPSLPVRGPLRRGFQFRLQSGLQYRTI